MFGLNISFCGRDFPMLGDADLALLAGTFVKTGYASRSGCTETGASSTGATVTAPGELARVPVASRTYEGDDADLVRFVVSLNLHRRHLDESQQAMVAARIATLEHGQRADLSERQTCPVLEQSEAASLLNVSERSVRAARSVVTAGSADLVSAVERGEVCARRPRWRRSPSRSSARRVARGEREIVRAANEIRARKRAERSSRVESAIAEKTMETATVADLQALAESGRRFGAIYADPPWLYGNQATRASTGNHYGGMTVAEIAALPVARLAADNAHLHLWTTNGFLFDCKGHHGVSGVHIQKAAWCG